MIEIIDLKQIPTGVCKYKFTVKIVKMGMEIRECGLFEHNGKKWIGLPQRQYETNGEKKYYNLVSMTPEMKKRFDDHIFKLLSEMIQKPVDPEIRKIVEEYGDLPF
jgi:hypothetical protein